MLPDPFPWLWFHTRGGLAAKGACFVHVVNHAVPHARREASTNTNNPAGRLFAQQMRRLHGGVDAAPTFRCVDCVRVRGEKCGPFQTLMELIWSAAAAHGSAPGRLFFTRFLFCVRCSHERKTGARRPGRSYTGPRGRCVAVCGRGAAGGWGGAARGAPLPPAQRAQAAWKASILGEHVGLIWSVALSPSAGASAQFPLLLLCQRKPVTGNKQL